MSTARTWIGITLLARFTLAGGNKAWAQGFSDTGNLVHIGPRDAALKVGVGIVIDQIIFVDQKAENFGAVATIQMHWHDPALAFNEEDYSRDHRLMSAEAFIDYANNIPTTVPTFIV